MTTLIDKMTFNAELVWEGSWGERSAGKHESTMELHLSKGGYFIEWDIPDLEATETIGLEFDGKELTDYDGVMSLPREAIALIRKNGFVVGKDFE